jgi:hypothetical protein
MLSPVLPDWLASRSHVGVCTLKHHYRGAALKSRRFLPLLQCPVSHNFALVLESRELRGAHPRTVLWGELCFAQETAGSSTALALPKGRTSSGRNDKFG